jgi:membrane protein
MIVKQGKLWWQAHPQWHNGFWRVVRFGLVGTLCTALHYGVYCLFLLFANANIAYTAGYGVGLVCNYVLTTYFTFQKKPTKANAAGFVGSHVFNYLLEMVLLNLFLWAGISKWLAPILVIAIAVPINFIMLYWVFKNKNTSDHSAAADEEVTKLQQNVEK